MKILRCSKIIIIFLCGCALYPPQRSYRDILDVVVNFESDGGDVYGRNPVYVSESFGNSAMIVTNILETDDNGDLMLSGAYCFPIYVYMDGGGVVLRGREKGRRKVIVSKNRTPEALSFNGPLPNNIQQIKASKSYENCILTTIFPEN